MITYGLASNEKALADFSIAMVNGEPEVFFQIAFKQGSMKFRHVRTANRHSNVAAAGCSTQPWEMAAGRA